MAGEKWRMDVFATHGKIYEASTSQMFKVPIEEITKGSLLRQKGKIAELALGYGGSVGALTAMDALEMGVKAALKAVKERTSVVVGRVKIHYESGILFIRYHLDETCLTLSLESNLTNLEEMLSLMRESVL